MWSLGLFLAGGRWEMGRTEREVGADPSHIHDHRLPPRRHSSGDPLGKPVGRTCFPKALGLRLQLRGAVGWDSEAGCGLPLSGSGAASLPADGRGLRGLGQGARFRERAARRRA